MGRGHSHSGIGDIDFLAQRSRLGCVNAALKCGCALGAIVLVLAMRSPAAAAFCALSLGALTVCVGKTPLRVYLRLLQAPAVFLAVSALALLFDVAPAPMGAVSLPFFGGYLCVSEASPGETLRILLTAMAAVSGLYALSLSTPMGELIGVLRQARVPRVIIELMYIIYRYIFLLQDTLSRLKCAAAGRQGFATGRCTLRTTGYILSALLRRSFMRAASSFDAMEARCYEGDIRFLEHRKPLCAGHLLFAAAWFFAAVAIAAIEKGAL